MQDSNRVIIIAEAGVNHNGDLKLAKQLVDVAAEAEVDYVKFQTFKADKIVSKQAKRAQYQKANTHDGNDSQYQMLKQLELSEEYHLELQQYSQNKGVKFFSTAFDPDGLEYLNTLGFEMFKVPSGEINNYFYLKKVASFLKPVVLSSGMAKMEEIEQAIEVLIQGGLKMDDITVLHCNTEYPTPMKDVNLKAMLTIREKLGVKVGYSDHTLGIEVPIAAVAMGAMIIEKHFTLSRNLSGPDHRASLEPEELILMTKSIRNIEMAISGSGMKEPSPSERKNIQIARKSLYYSNDLKQGQVIREEDLIALRPGDGISPMSWYMIVGKKTRHFVKKDQRVLFEDLV